MSDEEDVVWGEQAQLAVEREMNPPKGPGGNPKVDRRSTTGSNFMRCLPDQATSLTSDRTPFLGSTTTLAQQRCQRRRRSKFGTQLCRAGRDQRDVWAQVGGLEGPGGSFVDVMPMSHADGSGGSHVGSQVHEADGEMTNRTHRQSEDCSTSCSGQSGSFFFSRRHLRERAAGHCPPVSGIQIGADSRLSHVSQRSKGKGNSCDLCSISCGCSHHSSCDRSCSHHSSCGRSCGGSCFMHRHARHDCLDSMRHDRVVTQHSSFERLQSQTWMGKAPVSSCVSHSASASGRLAQTLSRLHLKANLRSTSFARCKPRAVQGCEVSCAQRQVASRHWL